VSIFATNCVEDSVLFDGEEDCWDIKRRWSAKKKKSRFRIQDVE
jgi:hypothetical protein